ncbi:MAG TPA: nucleotidyltransferase family protein [Steroidobacteraceae bacterium]
MILAAGRGERMRPLTDHKPKPLLEVGGKPLIQYHIENLAAAGVREIVVNLAWQGEKLREAIGEGTNFGVRIRYSDEGDFALETGGGICKALPLLGSDPFIVVSGDIWTQFPFESLRIRSEDVAHFVLVPNPEFHAEGDFGLVGTRVTESGPRFTYANIGIFTPEFFEGRKPERFPLAPLMYEWIRRGKVSGELYEGPWHNLGTPQQLAVLDAQIGERS